MLRRVSLGLIASALLSAAGCGGGGNHAGSTPTEPSHKAASTSNSKRPHCGDLVLGGRHPARLVQHPSEGWFPTQELWPVKSEWLVSDCRHLTVVDAGADAAKPMDGLFGIVRSPGPEAGNEARKTIPVPGAGALRITKAPLGPSVETSAQKHGTIEFTSESGITGALHLSDDTVTRSP